MLLDHVRPLYIRTVCFIEDDGGGEDPAGDDQDTDSTDTGDDGDDSADPPKERTYTKAELEQIVSDRVKRVRKEERGKRRSRKPSKEPKTEPKDTASEARDAWLSVLEDGHMQGLTKDQTKQMRRVFEAEYSEIDDAETWVEEYLAAWKPKEEPENKNKKTDTKPKKPRSDYGGASVSKDLDTVLDPNELTRDDIRRMELKHGKAKAHRMIREKVESFYARARVVPERRN